MKKYFVVGGVYIVDGVRKLLYWNGNTLIASFEEASKYQSHQVASEVLIDHYPKNLGIDQVEKTFIMEVIKNESN